MLLHRYFRSHVLETLRDRELRVSKPSEFKDPFEFYFKSAGNPSIREMLNCVDQFRSSDFEDTIGFAIEQLGNSKANDHLKELIETHKRYKDYLDSNREDYAKELVETFKEDFPPIRTLVLGLIDNISRVCCFIDANGGQNQEVLMWSHYANGHKGCRIKFEIDDSENPVFTLRHVDYSEDAPVVDIVKNQLAREYEVNEELNKQVISMVFTKAKYWRYEDEVRLLVTPEYCNKSRFFEFDSSWVKGIDFGLNCLADERDKIISLVRENYPGIELRKAVRDPDKYGLLYEPI